MQVGHKTKVGVNQKVTLPADVAVLEEAVVCASVSNLVLILEQMLGTGEVEIEDEPELEDVDGADEEVSELDYGDDDRLAEDQDREDWLSSEESPFRDDRICIRVRLLGKEWRCDVPQSGWEGVRGRKRLGKVAVRNISARMQIYNSITRMLEEEHGDWLALGPSGVRKRFSQADLIRKGCFDGVGGSDKATLLSRCLKSADLVWDDYGALPLRAVFKD